MAIPGTEYLKEGKPMVTYIISATDEPFGEIMEHETYTSAPADAVKRWFKCSEKYPTCTSLQPATEEAGMEILTWASQNMDQLEEWSKAYKCPYKITWMKEEIEKAAVKNKSGMQWEYDELFPFCKG